MIGGDIYNFRGSIALVPADNLASQSIGGYKALNSALRKCRHCMAVADNMCCEVHTFLFLIMKHECFVENFDVLIIVNAYIFLHAMHMQEFLHIFKACVYKVYSVFWQYYNYHH